VLDVPVGFDECDQFEIYPKLQHWRARVANASGGDLLFDLCGVEKV